MNIIILLLLGSASTQGQELRRWPAAPQKARIEYVSQILQIEDIIDKPSLFNRILAYFSTQEPPKILRPMGLDATVDYLAIADPTAGGVHLFNLAKAQYIFLTSGETLPERAALDVALAPEYIFVSYPENQSIIAYDYQGNLVAQHRFEGGIERPTGLAYKHPYLYAVDTKSHQAYRLNSTFKIVTRYGNHGSLESMLNYPTFICVTANDTVYISDTMNFRVQKYTQTGTWVNSIGEHGTVSGQFNRLKGLAVDQKNRIYAVDNSFDNIQIFNQQGRLLMYFGESGHAPGSMMMPTDIAISGDLIYVSDTLNKRIQIFRMLYD
ncbi:MAG: hypothetical protein L3J79_00455 [Candidatus Marinimicrobia bacterium]|nr:hypothetical protein [Candidatus Neomarinimicrobiota bacterium]